MKGTLQTLGAILAVPAYRRVAVGITALYLVAFLFALQDISRGGDGFSFLTADWTRMFDRRGAFTFEPIARLTLPGLTVLVSPLNVLVGAVLAFLAGLNLAVTWVALRHPAACSFNRSAGVLASLPALVAGSACCAPAIVLILGIQVSSLFMSVFQVLVPVSLGVLLVTLKLILDRTNPELL
jgi:hypothetical protein